MQRSDARRTWKLAMLVSSTGILGQFGSCDLGQITTTTTQTLDGREVIISLIRSAIVTPLDQWITDTINDAFNENV